MSKLRKPKATAAAAKMLPSNHKVIQKKEPPKLKVVTNDAVDTSKKTVSQRLLETIEKRKQLQKQPGKNVSSFGRIPGRRGRRPKNANVDYQPENREEDAYVLENEYERLEYDTGIRMNGGGEERGLNLDRMDNFDEELNFDW